MGDHDHGNVFLTKFLHDTEDAVGAFCVNPACGFVHNEKVGLLGNGIRQKGPLHLPPREFSNQLVHQRTQLKQIKIFFDIGISYTEAEHLLKS